MNNFQKLLDEQARAYDAPKRQAVENNLRHTMGVVHLIGQIVEVYLPTMVGVLITAAGGSEEGSERMAPRHQPPSLGEDNPGKIGPQPPGGDVPTR